jgi:hypothetical protein
MYYRAEIYQVEGGQTCFGIRSEIQNLNRSIDFSDSKGTGQRMVHCFPLTTHQSSLDATKYFFVV